MRTVLAAPSVITRTLGNGLKVALHQDRRLPIAAVCVWYRVGARDEPPGRTGMAHLLEHMMFQGSARVSPGAHSLYVQDAGGASNGDTTLEATYFLDEIPSNYLEPILWLEAERMATAEFGFSERRLETQRQVVLNERFQRYENKPLAMAWERLLRIGHPEGHPYQHMPAGFASDVRDICLADVRRFWDRYYHPGNAVLSVTGDVNVDQVMRWIDRYFGPLPSRGKVAARHAPPQNVLPAPKVENLQLDTANSGVMTLYRVPGGGTPEAIDVTLAVSVLGGQRDGRLRSVLARHIRVPQVRFRIIELASAPSLAVLEAAARDWAAENIDVTVRAELAELAARGPGGAELGAATQAVQHELSRRLATVEGLAVEFAKGIALYEDALHLYRVLEQTRTATRSRIREATRVHMDDAHRASLVYEPVPSRRGYRGLPAGDRGT